MDRQPNKECGDNSMCSMPAEASENEPIRPEPKGEVEEFLFRHAKGLTSFAAAYLITAVVAGLLLTMWDEDEIKLHLLHGMMRFCQTVAHMFGVWALLLEKEYGSIVDTLH